MSLDACRLRLLISSQVKMISGGAFGVDVPVQLESNCNRLFLLNLDSQRQCGQDEHLLLHCVAWQNGPQTCINSLNSTSVHERRKVNSAGRPANNMHKVC